MAGPQAINGDIKVKGVENNLDVTYSDAFSALKFFFIGHYEGLKGHWGNTFRSELHPVGKKQ